MRRIIPALCLCFALLAGCTAPHTAIQPLSTADTVTAPSAAPTAVPTPVPTPTQAPVQETELVYDRLGSVSAVLTTLTACPDAQSEVLCTLPQGQTLYLAPAQDGYYPARCGDTEGYVPVQDTADLGLQKEVSDGLVNVRLRDDTLLCTMLFAREDNFCAEMLYDADVCMLEPDTLSKLLQAQERFMQDGYRIKLNDAYRPQRVQYLLYERIPDRTYIADPSRGSRHNRGIAVDMTLVDMATGLEVEMPSPMHTFGGAGRRDYDGHSAEAKKNMDYMTDVMESCGFTSIKSEWWHFMDLSAEETHPVLDIPQSAFVLAE